MKDVDKRITDIVNKKINEPHSFENAIIHALDNVDNDKFNIRKMAVAICTTLIITTGIVHANEIRDYVISKFYYNHDQGIDEAINNGYIDLIDENQIAFGIKSDEMSIEAYETDIIIKDMLMDDYNLNFTFSIDVSDKINIKNYDNYIMHNILIADENCNILYCGSKKLFDEYCKNNRLNYDYFEENEHVMNGSMTGYIVNRDYENNKLDFVCSIINDREKKYPKSEKLLIVIDKFVLESKEIEPKGNNVEIDGRWELMVNVDEKFVERGCVDYKVKDNIYNDIDIIEAKLTNTGFTFKCKIENEPLIKENDTLEERNKKINVFQEYYCIDGKCVPNYIEDCYLEDKYGNKFYQPDSGIANPYIINLETGELLFKTGFTYTLFKKTDMIKIYFTINLPDDQRTICIEFKE